MGRVNLFLLALCLVVGLGCGYRFGNLHRSLPGGYHWVHIPVFQNQSMEPGIEIAFTNSLIQEFERSSVARVAEKDRAEVIAEGVILSVDYNRDAKIDSGTGNNLPLGSVLVTEYRIKVITQITLRHIPTQKVLWEGNISSERTYNPPQVQQAGINTVNPLYNLSARRQNIESMSSTMMNQAHDRMTENF